MNRRQRVACAIAATFVVALFSACSTVTIKERGIQKLQNEPTYEHSFDFYVGGLIGEYTVDGKKICHGSSPVQMQAVRTPMDTLLTIVTLTIYAPRSVKIWCNEGSGA